MIITTMMVMMQRIRQQTSRSMLFANICYGMRYSAYIWCFFAFLACGMVEDDDITGRCSLSCGNAKILPPGEFTVENHHKDEVGAITCAPGGGNLVIPDPYVFDFRVTQKSTLPGGKEEDDGGEGSSSSTVVGITGAKFNIMAQGQLFAKEKDQNKFPITSPSTGILTPSNQWCTDSCGILSVAVYLKCPPEGASATGRLQLSSGLHSISVSLQGKTEKPEEKETSGSSSSSSDTSGGTGTSAVMLSPVLWMQQASYPEFWAFRIYSYLFQ